MQKSEVKDMDARKHRETVLKAIRFEKPDYIPMNFVINPAYWDTCKHEALCDLMEAHPFLFPDFVRPELPMKFDYANVARKDEPYTDDWGCVWSTTMNGITGTVTKHPLTDWADYDRYKKPDPNKCMGIGSIDWAAEEQRIAQRKKDGLLTMEGLRHGHTFLQVCDIHGYENVLFDMEDEEPMLKKLLTDITDFNAAILQRYADMNVDILTVAEDLGMQVGPMLSPQNLADYILPCYERLADIAKRSGAILHMHSDGDIRTLADMLMGCGMDVLNLQDLVNGLDWIEENIKGKVCIELDIDRQKVTTYGSPKDIDDLIRQEVKQLGSKDGGLMMIYGLYPGVPLENAAALMDAMEKYAFYYN